MCATRIGLTILNKPLREPSEDASLISGEPGPRSVVAIPAALSHYVSMGLSDERSETSSALAQEAPSLRVSLLQYFGRRLRDRSDVDDLVQEVFARVVARDDSRPIQHLGRYLHQTAASVLADYARRRSVRRVEAHILFDPERHGEPDFDAERIVAARQEIGTATAALLSLPERTRTVFVLRRLDGVPAREVAAQLGLSVSAVEKHLVRAVRHLAQSIGGAK